MLQNQPMFPANRVVHSFVLITGLFFLPATPDQFQRSKLLRLFS
jgi:hypothetical protein